MFLSRLPSKDVGTLRLASKCVASVSHPEALPQFFWRSRFLPIMEMGFVQPPTEAYHDWRQLYFAIKAALANPQGSGSLKNRKRIWDIVSINYQRPTICSAFAAH